MKLVNRFAVLLSLSMPFASVASAAGWTSLAYDPQTGAWGRSQCEATYQDAIDIALNACDGNCQTVAYAYNGYVALATGSGGWATGSIHDSLGDTEQASLDRCNERNIANCQILVTGTGNAYDCGDY
jgi:hypothetical protein